MKKFIYIIALILTLSGCSRIPEQILSPADQVKIIIWDPGTFLQNQEALTLSLYERFPQTVIIYDFLSDYAMETIRAEFSRISTDQICIFMVISGRGAFQLSSEWNLWMPELWRDLDCRGKILIADAPWGDEFLNPVKTKKEDTIWVVNGALGHLRKKLPKSLLAASCRYDEFNLVSRGIDGKTKTPLFAWYFIDLLCRPGAGAAVSTDVVSVIRQAAELTATARKRGVVSDTEEVLFFNNSEIEAEEFLSYPHPVIWNGLAKKLILEEAE